MAERKSFLLRLPPALLDELNRWARDDLRSLNAQIEFLLREAVRRRRRKDFTYGEADEEDDAS
ncbi:MAG: hypothetical protein JXR94_00260 [Candidatus Hydrogenedentes bacterium]|nr:hypothetical protein [Candidatus Hydrogenedentota bacterium]